MWQTIMLEHDLLRFLYVCWSHFLKAKINMAYCPSLCLLYENGRKVFVTANRCWWGFFPDLVNVYLRHGVFRVTRYIQPILCVVFLHSATLTCLIFYFLGQVHLLWCLMWTQMDNRLSKKLKSSLKTPFLKVPLTATQSALKAMTLDLSGHVSLFSLSLYEYCKNRVLNKVMRKFHLAKIQT